jgi:hypothetical protein
MWKSALIAACLAGAASLAAPVLADDAKPAADSAKTPSDVTCATDTGTRIKRKSTDCGPSPTRRYTKDELDRTGQSTTAGALRDVSPSLTISH